MTRGKSNEIKTKFACILEASESTRLRVGESLPNHHEDHVAGKEDKSLQHYNLVHLFIPMPEATKIPQQRQQWMKNGRNWKRFQRGTWRKSEVRKRWSMKQGRRAEKFILHHSWIYPPRWHCKKTILVRMQCSLNIFFSIPNDSRQNHGYHLQIAQVAMDKHQTKYQLTPKWNWKMLTNYWKSQIGVSRHLDSSITTQMA